MTGDTKLSSFIVNVELPGTDVQVLDTLERKPSARNLAPAALKLALLNSAVQPQGISQGWNAQTGFGVVNAGAAFALV